MSPIHRRCVLVAGLFAALIGATVPATATEAASTCAAPRASTATDHAWLASAQTQQTLKKLDTTIRQVSPPPVEKTERWRGYLDQGVVGIAVDAEARTVAAVITPDRIASSSAATALAIARVPVRPACFTSAELLEAGQLLADRQWHPSAARSGYGFYLDAADPRFHVTIDDPAAATALQQRLGDLVVIAPGTPGAFSGGRGNDFSPHFGGAFIHDGIDERQFGCTAGFSVIFGDGRRGAVTAMHCYVQVFQPGRQIFSGVQEYGQLDGDRVAPFPAFDMVRMTQDDQTYTNKIYTDPGSPTQRTVTGAADPFQGQVLCVSGQLTGARCSIQVTNTGGSFCPDPVLSPEFGGQCVHDVMVASRPGIRVAQRGDSGAPIYSQTGGTNAAVHGILIGGNGSGDTIFAEKLSNIMNALDVTVAFS